MESRNNHLISLYSQIRIVIVDFVVSSNQIRSLARQPPHSRDRTSGTPHVRSLVYYTRLERLHQKVEGILENCFVPRSVKYFIIFAVQGKHSMPIRVSASVKTQRVSPSIRGAAGVNTSNMLVGRLRYQMKQDDNLVSRDGSEYQRPRL